MSCIVIRPDRHTQFGAVRMPRFCLATDPGNPLDLRLAPSSRYSECLIVPLEPGESLADFLTRAPQDADLLVVCPQTFTTSPGNEQIGPRRLSVLPCASTPVTPAQLEYFLEVCERTDQQALQAACERIVNGLEAHESIQLTDGQHDTTAVFHAWHDYEWNQQAGAIEFGEQQIAPGGEFSAIPIPITSFDRSARLELSGQVTLNGTVIVHRGGAESPAGEAERLYRELATLREQALVLDLEGGLIKDLRPIGPEAKPAADALELLFGQDENYRVLWEFGFGLNPEIVPVEGNCGLNEMYGGPHGQLHLGLGLTPSTQFALTFSCADTTVRAGQQVLAAPAQRRLRRLRSAACGCAEGAGIQRRRQA